MLPLDTSCAVDTPRSERHKAMPHVLPANLLPYVTSASRDASVGQSMARGATMYLVYGQAGMQDLEANVSPGTIGVGSLARVSLAPISVTHIRLSHAYCHGPRL
jgi:hypothetical protein